MAANMYRYRVNLDGWQGAPGVNTLYFRHAAVPTIEDAQQVADLIKTAYDSLKAWYVSGVKITVDPNVDVIQDSDGKLQTSTVIVPPATVTGSGATTTTSRATMALAKFNTDAVVNGRRLRGRSFLGPIAAQGVATDGTLTTAFGTAILSAYNGLLDIAGGRLVVWHRPSAPGAQDGTSGFVQNVTYKTLPAVLRSRRD